MPDGTGVAFAPAAKARLSLAAAAPVAIVGPSPPRLRGLPTAHERLLLSPCFYLKHSVATFDVRVMIMWPPRCGGLWYTEGMKNFTLIAVGIIAVVVLAIMFLGRSPMDAVPADLEEYPTIIYDEPMEEAASAVTVQLSAQNKSGESGTATLADENGKTRVVLKLVGAPSGVSQPAHIHMGSCADLGGIKYPLSYPVDGNSETLLDVLLAELKVQLPLAVMVHKNLEELGVYMACGDVRN